MSSIVVTVDRTKTVSITRNEPAITTVVETSPVTAIVSSEPSVSEIERTSGDLDLVLAGQLGPRGPQGDKGEPGDIAGTTDQLTEGGTNLYFTDQRAAAAFDSAMAVAVATGDGVDMQYDSVQHQLSATNTDKGSDAVLLHLSVVDPHPQYIDADDVLDGGNF